MTHAINSNTNLLSIDITKMHTQVRMSPRGEKESGKEMRRESKKKDRIKENLKKNERKKSINKLKLTK